MNKEQVLEVVQERYGAIARGEQSGCGCGCKNEVAEAIGYTAEDLAFAGEGNLGLGCGNPLALAEIQAGMAVLDLGSGAGFDAFLAWRQVGSTGRVIGVDMTDDMLARAREKGADAVIILEVSRKPMIAPETVTETTTISEGSGGKTIQKSSTASAPAEHNEIRALFIRYQ